MIEPTSGEATVAGFRLVRGVVVAWLAFGVFSIGVRLLAMPQVAAPPGRPDVAVGDLPGRPAAGGMVSSRTSDPRLADQISMLVMLPLFLVLIGQVTGMILLNAQLVIYIAVGVAVVDAGLMAFAVNLFQR